MNGTSGILPKKILISLLGAAALFVHGCGDDGDNKVGVDEPPETDVIWVDAGKSRTAAAGQTIHLSARGYGDGSDALFSWVQLSPDDARVTLSEANTDNPSFVAPDVDDRTTLVFKVTFADGVSTATDTVSVEVNPVQTVAPNTPLTLPGAVQQPPLVLVAQPSAEVAAGSVQTLTAVASGGDGHYTWSWKKPVSSSSNPACQTAQGPDDGQVYQVTLPGACPEQDITYKIGVIVTDGQGQSAEQDTDLWMSVPGGLPLNVYAPTVVTDEGPLPVAIGAAASGGTGPYSYSWTQTGGPDVSASLIGADTATPSFTPPAVDADTTLTFKVTATDGASNTAEREMNVLVRNAFALTPPQILTLQVPPPAKVLAGNSVSLAATASGGTPPYAWSWQQTAGATATLGGTTTDTITITPASGADSLSFEVTATDSAGTPVVKKATVQVEVLAAPTGAALTVPAIPKQYVDEGLANVGITTVPEGGTGPYTYSWQFIPSGGLVAGDIILTDTDQSILRFDAPQVSAQTMLQFRLTVTDAATPAATATADAYVVINDITPPLALNLTGPELTAHSGHTVSLSIGSPRGGQSPYSYAWTQTAGPTVTLTDPGDGSATFTAPTVAAGSSVPLSFELTVTDAAGSVQRATQRVVIDQGMAIARLVCPTADVTVGTDLTVSVDMVGGSTPAAATTPLHYTWTTQAPVLTGLPDANTFTKTVPSSSALGTMKVSVSVRDSGNPAQVKTQSCSVTLVGATVTKPGSTCLVCGTQPKRVLDSSGVPTLDTDGWAPWKGTGEACNDLDLVLGTSETCPDTYPYCMNTVIQRFTDASRTTFAQYERRYCSDQKTTDSLWYRATSDDPLCLPFDPNSAPDGAGFSSTQVCHLSCYGGPSGPICNEDTNPPDNTLYRP